MRRNRPTTRSTRRAPARSTSSLNDRDPDEDPLHVAATGTPGHGTASCAALGGCLYTPDAGYEGDDAFTYTVADSDGLEKTATVTVHVIKPPATSAVFVARDDAGLDARR